MLGQNEIAMFNGIEPNQLYRCSISLTKVADKEIIIGDTADAYDDFPGSQEF